MFNHIRKAAHWIAQQLFPATGHYRQRAPVRGPLPRTARTALALRPHGTAAPASAIWAEDTSLIRPYVLSADEWARRRRQSLSGAVTASP